MIMTTIMMRLMMGKPIEQRVAQNLERQSPENGSIKMEKI